METCNSCKYWDKDMDEAPCNRCIHNALNHFKPMTNFDRIKRMTIEELASFLCACSDCGNGRCYGDGLCKPGDGTCNGIIKYLKSEVTDDGNSDKEEY